MLDRNVSLGFEGALFTDIKASLYGSKSTPNMYGFIAGLGGRDVTKRTFMKMFKKMETSKAVQESEFSDLRPELLEEV